MKNKQEREKEERRYMSSFSSSSSSLPAHSSSPSPSLTFCLGVSGWLFSYYFGVVKVLKESGKAKDCKVII